MPEPDGSSSGRSTPPSTPGIESVLGVEIGAWIAGKYRVERVIGKGGMGVVVAASQPALERTVAIKLMRTDSAEDQSATMRLLREAKAAASIQSEHVAHVLDVGTLDSGVPFIVMEYLEGSDLQTLLDRDGPLPPADAVDFLLQACEAIAEAHRNGIVHRDLKPANLFMARLPGGRSCVKVVDFGISKTIGRDTGEPLTRPASVVGSLYHMAPEQMRGAPVDARTDVWALGLLLYEMLTGEKPFNNRSWPEVAAQVLAEGGPLLSAPMGGVSEELQAVIHKCLSRSPEQRYGTVAELAVALSRSGSRRAHLSLERIVLLATSTGSLSALALEPTQPARDSAPELLETKPVPGGGFSPVPPPRTSADTPLRATPATPFPVSTAPRPATAASPPWRLALGVVGALALLAPLVVWLWPEAPERHEERALPPMAPAAARGGERVERADREALPGAQPPSRAETPAVPGAGAGVASMGEAGAPGGGAPGGAQRANATADAASGAAAAHGAVTAGSKPIVRPIASPPPAAAEAPPAGPPREAATREPVERTIAPAPAASDGARADTGAPPAEPAEPPSPPPRAVVKAPAKPASPWDLHDIEFSDEGKR